MRTGRQGYHEVRNSSEKISHSSKKSVRSPGKSKPFSPIHKFQNTHGPRRIFILCQTMTYFWGCSRAILLSGQGYFSTFPCLAKEAGVWDLGPACRWFEAAHGTHHHLPWFWRIIFLVGKEVEASCSVQMLSWKVAQNLLYWCKLPPTCADRSREGHGSPACPAVWLPHCMDLSTIAQIW